LTNITFGGNISLYDAGINKGIVCLLGT